MKNNKKVVRLTESKLKQMIAEAVNEAVEEGAIMNGVRNVANRIGGALNGAYTGYKYGAAQAKSANRYDTREKGGVDRGENWEQYKNEEMSDAVDSVIEYIGRMGAPINDTFIQQLTQALKNREHRGYRNYWSLG